MSRIFYVLIAFVFFSGCGISQQYVIHSPVAIGNPQRTGSVLFECEGPAESTDVILSLIHISWPSILKNG